MTLSPVARRVLLVIALLLLLGLTWLGLSGGLQQLAQSHTTGQRVQTFTQTAYGLLALLSAVTTFWARRWGALMKGLFVVTVALAGGLASVVWGGTTVAVGLLAGAGVLLGALAIIALLGMGARGLTRDASGRALPPGEGLTGWRAP